jgi:hypothetical protein
MLSSLQTDALCSRHVFASKAWARGQDHGQTERLAFSLWAFAIAGKDDGSALLSMMCAARRN